MSDVIYNISSGFFDSVNGDRLYSAADMNKPYKRVIADGIFPTPQGTPSTDFQVVAVSGMSVAVLAGNAMIGSRWAENTDDVGITIAGNSSSSPRIDSIFLHIDTGMDTRAAGVVYRQGTAAGTPTAPAMVQTDNITELRLADILVAPSASIITQANITDQRGGSDCPWVAGLIQQVDTSALFDQYRAAYAEQQQDQANEWNTFMAHLARDYDISMSLRKHESTYTSTAAASLIPINIDGYDTTKDLLQVYINGIFAVEGTHYIVKSAAQIQLTNAISAGQKVHFVIYKAVMGGAQPIIPTDEQVQDAVDAYMDAHPGALVVDPELSDTSTHAIQNKAVTEALAGVNGRLAQVSNSVGSEKSSAVSLVSGGFSNSTGVDYVDWTKVRFANLIQLGVGDKMVADSSLQWYWACYSDESGTTLVDIRSAGFTSGEYTIATGGWYKFVYRLKNDTSADLRERTAEIEALISIVYAEPRTGLFKDVDDLKTDVEDLTNEQNELSNQFDNVAKKVVSDKVTTLTMRRDQFISGILNPDGSVQSSSAIFYTTIPVESGDVVTVKTFYLGSDGTAKGITDKKILAVCAYNGGNPVPSSGKIYNANADNYVVPDGIGSIGVSFSFSGANDRCYIYRTVPNGNTDYYEVQTTFKNPLLFSGNLSAGVFQSIGSLVCIDAYILTATCRIDGDFQSLKIGGSNVGQTGLIRPYIEVTPTQVKLYSNTSSSFDKAENHGLTLSDDLQIIVIASKESLTARVIVQSKGARWTSGNYWRIGTAYYGFGIVSDTAMSVVSVSVSVRDLHKPVWVCGDSWVTLYDARWYGQAVSLGIADFLHSGHSGEGSEEGLKHLKTLLSMYTPKMIVWLYGMNDMDTDSSTPNSAWLTALNEVKTICEDRTVTLVLATIPTTPTRNNNAKNAVVTASGYRYVDEVSAMGADTAGNWISGYQSDDGNHTTEAGAKALLAQVLADVPEIGLMN